LTSISETTYAGRSRFVGAPEQSAPFLDAAWDPAYLDTSPIPITRVVRSEATRQVSYYPPRRPARSSRARAPAPLGLRILVSALLLVLLACAGGLVMVRTHPGWLSALRNNVPPETRRQAALPPQQPNRVALVSSSSTAVTYRVPTRSYSIVVAIDHPCWLVVKSPASASSLLVATTLSPSSSPMSIPVHGSASITVSARTQSISITEGSKVLETIYAPVLGVAYTFLPAT